MKMIRILQPGPITYTRKVFIVIFHIAWIGFSVAIYKKVILVHYANSPTSIFSVAELLITIALLQLGRSVNMVQVPKLDGRIFRRILPILIIYFSRVVTSVDGIEREDKPLFNVSCRFVLLVTTAMLFERVFLNIQHSVFSQVSIAAMTVGGMIVGVYDEPVWLSNYILIVLNNIFSAAHGVYTNIMLDSRELGVYGIWYYNVVIMLVPSLFVAYITDVFEELSINWEIPMFLCHLFVMSLLGMISSYSVLLCIYYNGALTTIIIGSLYNALKTWLELLNSDGEQYGTSSWHYLGLSIISIACLAFLYKEFEPKTTEVVINQNVDDSV